MFGGATQLMSLLRIPSSLTMASSEWEHARLVDPRLRQVMARMADMRVAGVTISMVIRELLRR